MNRVCETVAWLVVTPIWGLDRARTWTETHLHARRPAR